MVRPMKLGKIVDLLDQVLIGLRSRLLEATSTFLAKCASMNGPFLTERAISITSYSLDDD